MTSRKYTPDATAARELDRIVGARLKFYRLAHEFSQTKLGKEAGITFQQIQKYENGANRITVSRLIEFSRILGFTMAEFFDGICEDTPKGARFPSDVIDALSSPQSVELNRCFADVKSLHLRRIIVQLVSGVGAVQQENDHETIAGFSLPPHNAVTSKMN